MFNFFRKNKKTESNFRNIPKHYIANSRPEKIALLSSHFFGQPEIFALLKDSTTSKKKFIEDNFLNLHYVYGARKDFELDYECNISDIKEAMNFGWGIKDKDSFNELVSSSEINTLDNSWDIIRLSHVTLKCYTVGFVDLNDAKKIIFDLGTQLMLHYDTWEDVAHDFLTNKLRFNSLKKIKDSDSKYFADVLDILRIMDLFFNDPDSPFFSLPLNPNEDLKATSDNLIGNFHSLYERAAYLCYTYEEISGWMSHWITVGSSYDDLELNFLDFIDENLELEADEDFIFAHAKLAENPRDSDFDLILTTKNLFLFPTGDFDKDAYYLRLKDLGSNTITFKRGKLYVENDLVKDSFHFDLKNYENTYAQIVNHLIEFVKSRS